MPDRRQHRGRHPDDERLFAPCHWPALRTAVADLSWRLSRGYAAPSALKIVGDRYGLEQRQRVAVGRSSCSNQAHAARMEREVGPELVWRKRLLLDGFNVLLTIEAALSRGVLLLGRDGCLRDLASVHGTYRQVEETPPAVELIAKAVEPWQPSVCVWYLDAPVSNSGRLAQRLRAVGEQCQIPWEVELVNSPDKVLSETEGIAATADNAVLDRCGSWLNLTRHVLGDAGLKAAIDLRDEGS